jgi:hypothetical protein
MPGVIRTMLVVAALAIMILAVVLLLWNNAMMSGSP